MPSGDFQCGIAYRWAGQDYHSYLPLQKLDAHAEIIEASAIITLTQSFFSSVATREGRPYARYAFPLPDNAVVCEFEMRRADGEDVVAVVQDQRKAKATYAKAHKANKAVGLAERVSENVFSISLGNLPDSMIISTKLTYALDISSGDDQDQLRLHVPVCFGAYNGTGPGQTIPSNRVNITANIRMKGPVHSVTSPSHPHLITTFASSRPDEQLPPYEFEPKCTAVYRSPDFLSTDFVLMITCPYLSKPLCVAERHPSGSVAFRLGLVPELKLPPITRQEYIFLVDRSASMYGDRIETAKKTLVLLLHALPSSGTMFNIFSFGSWHSSLWTESREYTQDSLTEACEYVDEMTSNHGGTDICDVLTAACASRNRSLPTACFLLTDGEVLDDPTRTLGTVMRQVERSTLLQPLRVFTLGIGEQASISMCEAIARAGNGVSLMATTTEDMVSKCSRLVRLSRSPICEVTADWRQPPHRGRPLFDWCKRRVEKRVQLGEVPSLMEGVRFTQYALVKQRGYVVPKELVLFVRVIGKEETTDVVVPVEALPEAEDNTLNARGQFHLVHSLAVHSIIRRLEDEDGGLAGPENVKRISALAKRYHLMTNYTSLVAVADKRKPLPQYAPPPANSSKPRGSSMVPTFSLPSFALRSGKHTSRPGKAPSQSSALVPNGKSKDEMNATSTTHSPLQAELEHPKKEYHPDPTYYSQEEYGHHDFYDPTIEPSPEEYARAAFHSALNSTSGDAENYSFQPRYQVPPFDRAELSTAGSTSASKSAEGRSTWKLGMSSIRGSGAFRFLTSPTSRSTDETSSDGIDSQTMQLIRLQSFDGSFSPSTDLENILGRAALYDERQRFEDEKNLKVSIEVWATALALAYLRKNLSRQEDLLSALSEKAMEYLGRYPEVPVETVLERASLLLES